MVVSSTGYGTFTVFTGTLNEVCTALAGTNMKKNRIFWNGTNYTGIRVD